MAAKLADCIFEASKDDLPMPAAAQQPTLNLSAATDLSLPQAEILYRPAHYPAAIAESIFDELAAGKSPTWSCDEIRMFGRKVLQPRLTAYVADPGVGYSYSGLALNRQPWTPLLEKLRADMEEIAGCRFNSLLLNQYRDGSDYMGWHCDDERELGDRPVIASLSFGESRFFDLRHRDYRHNELPRQRFELGSGDVLIMRGETQRYWQHRVPKQVRRGGCRINLTFRSVQRTPHS